jgi:hypothetical protein
MTEPREDPLTQAIRAAVRVELTALLADFAPPASKPALLSTKALAVELDVCGKTIARLCTQGMPCVYVGDRVPRYVLSDVLAWLKSRPSVA